MLHLLDDTPVVPGDPKPVYHHASQARQVLNDAEDDLRDWQAEPDNYTAEAAGGAAGEEESKAEVEHKEAEGSVSEKEKAPALA